MLVPAAFLAAATAAAAQGTVVVGGSGRPEVEVNLGALNQLGGGAPAPYGALPLPGEAPQAAAPVHLHPPGTRGHVAKETAPKLKPPAAAKPAARPKQTAKATTSKPAASKPAASKPGAAKPAPPSRTAAAAPPAASKPPPAMAVPQPEAPANPSTTETVPAPPPPPPTPAPPANNAASTPPQPSVVAGGALGPIGNAPMPPPPTAVEKPPQRDVAVVPALPPAGQPAASVATPPAKVAAVPPATVPSAAGEVSVPFQSGDAALSKDAQQRLASLASDLSSNDARLQLKAYAGSAGDPSSGARRLSLSRALAVRSYLIDKGIRSTRIDVRALGAANSGPPDRVDVVVLGQ